MHQRIRKHNNIVCRVVNGEQVHSTWSALFRNIISI